MRAKSVKHVEYEILKYVLTEEGANLAYPRGLTDLLASMGADFDEYGEWVSLSEAKDKPAQKRCLKARSNIGAMLFNMLVKRVAYLPNSHPDSGCERDDLLDVMKGLID
jgi:hypothetical protein